MIRKAKAVWQGTGRAGSGRISTDSGVLAETPYSFRTRFEGETGTNPEELIAAAHAGCFAMQFSALLGGAGGSDQSLDVTADVTLGPDPTGGFRISGIKLTVRGSAHGVSAEDFARLAGDAKSACPVSKALTGTNITLDVAGS
jgi:lipoyl-dependent peroxiredoxin